MVLDTVQKSFLSKSGEGQMLGLSGLRVKVSSDQTGGVFELIELGGSGGPLPHVHREHDECFYIIEGTFTFILNGQELIAPADSVVFVPRGTPHAFKPGEGARGFVFIIPAHLEGFFRELGQGLSTGTPEAEVRATLAGKYDTWPTGKA